jgi:hypothetical protein
MDTIEELLSNFPRYIMEKTEVGVLPVQDRQGEWVHYEELKETLEKLLTPVEETT